MQRFFKAATLAKHFTGFAFSSSSAIPAKFLKQFHLTGYDVGNSARMKTKEGDVYHIENPLDGVLAALAGCEVHTSEFHSERLGMKIDSWTFRNVSGYMDMRGVMAIQGKTPMLQEAWVDAIIETDAP